MKDSNLFQLVLTLNRKEYNAFQKFIISPYFNQRKDVQKLWLILQQYLPTAPDPKTIYPDLYPDEPHNDQKMRLVMSYLYRQLEEFLLYEFYQRDKIQRDLDLLTIFRERQFPKRFKTISKRLIKKWNKEYIFDKNYYYQQYQFAHHHYLFNTSQKRTNPQQIQSVSDNLDTFFIAEKLRQSCIAVTHQSVFDANYDFGLLSKVLEQIEAQPAYLNISAIAVYYYCFLLLKSPAEEAHFIRFRDTIFQFSNDFSIAEMRDLYILAINFCSRRYNRGQVEYIHSAMTFYQKGLQEGYFFINGILSRFTFRNIVTVGLITKEYDWIENFIETYYPYLEKSFRTTSYNFSLARLAYERGQLQKALSLLQSTDYQDVLISLSAKTVMLKIFYQLDEWEVLESQLNAMQAYIRRKEVIGYHRENYMNLVRFLQKVIMVNPFDTEAVEALKVKLDSYQVIAERKWLQEVVKNR